MTKRRFQLDTGAVFLRLALYFFVLREAFVWLVWMRRLPRRPGRAARVLPLPEMGDAPLDSLCPAVRRRGDDVAVPARPARARAAGPVLAHALDRRVGRTVPRGGQRTGARAIPGTPRGRAGAGRPERWSRPTSGSGSSPGRTMSRSGRGPLDALREIHLEPAPRIAWGYIHGWPERLSLRVAATGRTTEIMRSSPSPTPTRSSPGSTARATRALAAAPPCRAQGVSDACKATRS